MYAYVLFNYTEILRAFMVINRCDTVHPFFRTVMILLGC